MLKDQLSRVPWPANLWMPFPTSCLDISATSQTFTLTTASYSELAHHYIQ